MEATVSYLLMLQKYQFKDYALCLGNISKDFAINNLKKNGIRRSCKILFC